MTGDYDGTGPLFDLARACDSKTSRSRRFVTLKSTAHIQHSLGRLLWSVRRPARPSRLPRSNWLRGTSTTVRTGSAARLPALRGFGLGQPAGVRSQSPNGARRTESGRPARRTRSSRSRRSGYARPSCFLGQTKRCPGVECMPSDGRVMELTRSGCRSLPSGFLADGSISRDNDVVGVRGDEGRCPATASPI
jgi:hypothetical protein